MAMFSERSKRELKTCHPALQTVFLATVKYFDCTIIEGKRNKARQNRLQEIGRSKVRWPASRHNTVEEDGLSEAVDVAPYPVDWDDIERFYFFAGFVLGIARSMGIQLRWGGDWDSDTQITDQTFNDLPHFELKE